MHYMVLHIQEQSELWQIINTQFLHNFTLNYLLAIAFNSNEYMIVPSLQANSEEIILASIEERLLVPHKKHHTR